MGTLPGRKPLILTLVLRSASCESSLEARSPADTTTLYSRFSPWLSVSVTCIAKPPVSHRSAPDPPPPRVRIVLVSPSRWRIACNAPQWCGRRDSNPHDFGHRNLNPARLPVPPRPRSALLVCEEAVGTGRALYQLAPRAPAKNAKLCVLRDQSLI